MSSKLVHEVLSRSEIRKIADKVLASVYVPSSVYRLQLNYQFTFRDAIRLIPYLKELGIGAVYSSPYFQATPKCLHGYNVTNPNRINPEIGSEKDFDDFCAALKKHGMGQILDVVPNHMGIASASNLLWMDVLENGPSSRFSDFFDIEWEPEKKELKDKVLLPILSDHYGQVLEREEIKLTFDGNQFWIRYWDHQLPIAVKSYAFILSWRSQDLKDKFGAGTKACMELRDMVSAFRDLPFKVQRNRRAIKEVNRKRAGIKERFQKLIRSSEKIKRFVNSRVEWFSARKGDPASFDLLDQLLGQQYYRMAHWRVAADEINYRRFFNINELAAIRVEDREVFDHHHKLTLRLLKEDKVQGFRVDHPDGLYDPPEYFARLTRAHLLQKIFSESIINYRDLLSNETKRRQAAELIKAVLESKHFTLGPSFFIVAEKILDQKEFLPPNWTLHGTTGYDFLNSLNGLFVYRHHVHAFDRIYEQFTGEKIDFEELIYQRKKFFGLVQMASEVNALGHKLDQISERNRRYPDLPTGSFQFQSPGRYRQRPVNPA